MWKEMEPLQQRGMVMIEPCDRCGKMVEDSPSGWCEECYKEIQEQCWYDLFWKNLFGGPWHKVNTVTRTFNILGMKHWAVIIEEWWNYQTHETKIITHKWKNGQWETTVNSK